MSRVAFSRSRQSPYSRRNQRIDKSISWTQFQKLLVSLPRSSLVSRHTITKGRVVESAGIRTYRKRSGPAAGITAPGLGLGRADKAQTHCPRSERLVPWVLKNGNCLGAYELLNNR